MESLLIIIGISISLITLVISLINLNQKSKTNDNEIEIKLLKTLNEHNNSILSKLNQDNEKTNQTLNNFNKEYLNERVSFQESINQNLNKIIETTSNNIKTLNTSLNEGFERINNLTSKKLEDIQSQVSDKLDKSLNQRLDENFKQVGQRLEELYKSLGEIKNLETGIVSLNKTLSNVKSRGVFGEIQLVNILENILDASQYEKNVKLSNKSNDLVEIAIKIPSKDEKNDYIYLPIDAKFPNDIYEKIVNASDLGNAILLSEARKELRNRILEEAKKIKEKYVLPPTTTDFAILFLPTESLYAEVLRLDGIASICQEKHKIIIAGPMNLTAMLNSLSVGFKYLTLNKNAQEIGKTLGKFKKDFETFTDLIEKSKRQLNTVINTTEDISKRNQIIKTGLSKIQVLEHKEENNFLE